MFCSVTIVDCAFLVHKFHQSPFLFFFQFYFELLMIVLFIQMNALTLFIYHVYQKCIDGTGISLKCRYEMFRCRQSISVTVHSLTSLKMERQAKRTEPNLCGKYVNIVECHSLLFRYLFPFALNTIAIIYELLIFTRSKCSIKSFNIRQWFIL